MFASSTQGRKFAPLLCHTTTKQQKKRKERKKGENGALVPALPESWHDSVSAFSDWPCFSKLLLDGISSLI